MKAFQERPLAAEYPILWVDAVYEKDARRRAIISEAVLVIHAVNLEGKREVLLLA